MHAVLIKIASIEKTCNTYYKTVAVFKKLESNFGEDEIWMKPYNVPLTALTDKTWQTGPKNRQ